MANTSYETYEKEIINAIKKHNIMRFDHLFGLYKSIGRTKAYELKLNESDAIKRELEDNRSKGVVNLIAKWMESDNATLQLAAMRMICDSNDHRRLNQTYIDQNTNNTTITPEEFWKKVAGDE